MTGWPRFIHELANNHSGSVEHGCDIIRSLPKAGGIKFQYRDLSILHPEYETKHHKRFRETFLTDAQRYELVGCARDEGFAVIITPFDEPSVEMAVRHGVDFLKVASCSADDWPLLESIAETGIPVIASTGGKTIREVDNLYYFLKHRNVDFALMHCVGIYPTPADKLNLNRIDVFRKRYDVPIGYSGHEGPEDHWVGMLAVAKGATILERHVGKGKLNAYSMGPEQAHNWVEDVEVARAACTFSDGPSPSETESLQELARGDWGGSLMMPRVFGDKQSAPLTDKDPQTKKVRDYIHRYEGMFREAGIPLKGDAHLSHHYGIDFLDDTGAYILDVVNREYCKKLIAMLPGQAHPPHLHKKKEEVFQVLHGDLTVVLDGKGHGLKVGDTLLVERGVQHSFSSVGGCIFEEISSTHYRDDSFYDDPRIADPMNRKTALAE